MSFGADSNVLVAYLMPDHPDHEATRGLMRKLHAVNPTVLHETYHTQVFKLKRRPDTTIRVLLDYMNFALCLPVSSETVGRAFDFALQHQLGGRDGLILASYLFSGRVRRFVTMDESLLSIKEVKLGRNILGIIRPAK